jgi:hypothetical protein
MASNIYRWTLVALINQAALSFKRLFTQYIHSTTMQKYDMSTLITMHITVQVPLLNAYSSPVAGRYISIYHMGRYQTVLILILNRRTHYSKSCRVLRSRLDRDRNKAKPLYSDCKNYLD